MTLPVEVNPLLQAPASTAYTINNSLRFRSSASAYLSRTLSAGSQTSWTWSCWFKRGALGTLGIILAAPVTAGSSEESLYISASDTLVHYNGGTGTTLSATNAVFRDPSAWYHIVYVFDSNNATASLRGAWYINGVLQSNSANNISLGYASYINRAALSAIGRYSNISSNFLDGYLAEVNFIGGSSLAVSNFGAYNSIGVWQPKQYTGSYAGTNSFYLKFASFGTTAALGTDSSGNGNTWTVNNFSVTAGTTYDPMLDSPTLTSATVANYCVLNPINSTGGTFSNGNLQFVGPTAWRWALSTFQIPTNVNIYAEATLIGTPLGNADTSVYAAFGIVPFNWQATNSTTNPLSAGGLWINDTGWVHNNNATGTNSGSAFALGDVIGLAFNPSTGAYTFYKNGTSISTGTFSLTGPFCFANSSYSSANGQMAINFGQRPFSYTPPTGYVRLNAYNLPTPTITNGATVMAATTYTGTGATQNILNSNNTTTVVSFKPDMVWVKSRSAATNNNLFDSVRAATNYLISNSTAAEATNANTLTAFNSNGFSLGSDASSIGVNISANTYIGWQWQAGQGSTSSNTNGSITSTVSVNATAGFSVVTFTAPASGNITVGHGLGVAPAMVIVKNRTGGSFSWYTWHQSFSSATNSYVVLNGTQAVDNVTYNMWGASGNNSSTLGFTVGNSVIASSNEVAYCWSAVAGYSAFGSYTGNGSADGPFVYTGFRPRFIMIKDTTTAGLNWMIMDTSRLGYNVNNYSLSPNSSGIEQGYTPLDILSNGFKIRTTDANWNSSSDNYIYAAFAENPFKYALAR